MARTSAAADAAERVSGPISAPRSRKTTTDPRQAVYAALSERAFQAEVVGHLRRRGWVVWTVPNMRLTSAGLPDILAVHAGRDVLIAWELKTEAGRLSPIQRAVLAILETVPGVYARVVRPSDWPRLRDEIDADPPAREEG